MEMCECLYQFEVIYVKADFSLQEVPRSQNVFREWKEMDPMPSQVHH